MDNHFLVSVWPGRLSLGVNHTALDLFIQVIGNEPVIFKGTGSREELSSRMKGRSGGLSGIDCIQIYMKAGTGEGDLTTDEALEGAIFDASDWTGVMENCTSGEYTKRLVCSRELETYPVFGGFHFQLSDFVVKSAEGITSIKIDLSFHTESVRVSEESYVMTLEKTEGVLKILDFYANDGAVARGKKERLHWKCQGAKYVTLTDSNNQSIDIQNRLTGEIQVDALSKNMSYTLTAWNQSKEKAVQRSITVQVLGIRLGEFKVLENDRGEAVVYWKVFCPGEIKLKEFPEEKLEGEGEKNVTDWGEQDKAVLTCKDAKETAEAALFLPKGKLSEQEIRHFSRVLYTYEGFRFLYAGWETTGLKEVEIVFEDQDRKIWWTVSKKEKGCFEQLLEEHEENVVIRLQAVRNDGSRFDLAL